MVPDRENIRFNVLRNALYHTSRRRHFERCGRAFTFFGVMLGTSVATDLLKVVPFATQLFGVGVAAAGTLQLVFDFGGAAREHQALQRDYYALLADIEGTLVDDEETRARWYAQMLRITGDEPPTLRAIDAKAYNDALDATEIFDAGERLVIPWNHHLFGPVWPFDGHRYRKTSEA